MMQQKSPQPTSPFSLNPTNPENPQILKSSNPQNPISPPALNLPLALASPGSISMITSSSWARLFSPRNLPSLVEWKMKMKLVVEWLFFSSMRPMISMPARDTFVYKSITIRSRTPSVPLPSVARTTCLPAPTKELVGLLSFTPCWTPAKQAESIP